MKATEVISKIIKEMDYGKIETFKAWDYIFLLSFIPIIYAIIDTIIDFILPISTGFNKRLAISYFIMNFMFAISLVSFIFGIIAIKQRGYKKVCP